ncbi:hypothetical protein [Streptomyces sp. NPDC008121]|uniref:hypothetical protein n=1 Tax=Streptomyces sp. NPDC008121 TaxID=3364809 RepID=UPI0036F00177
MAVTVAELIAEAAGGQSGALWRLGTSGRQLDANLVRLLPDTGVAVHTEAEVDVLFLAVAGGGSLTVDGAASDLVPGALTLLPRGAARRLQAGPDGLVYLTAHRRRAGMSIARQPRTGPGAQQCAVHLVCGRCQRHAIEADARFCSRCGTPLAPRPAAT